MTPAEIEKAAIARFGQPNRKTSTPPSGRQRRGAILRFGKKNGSIVVELTGDKAGAWYDHSSGEGGWLRPADGSAPPPTPSRPEPERFETDQDRRARVYSITRQCRWIDDTPADAYLASRGITKRPVPASVRYLPEPRALVGIAVDGGGRPLAVQLVYLTADGHKNTARQVAKRTLKAGYNWNLFAAVRFQGRGELVLCEGIETGLSIWQAAGRPVWACLGIPNIGSVGVGKRRKWVTIASDGDALGSDAEKALWRAVERRSEQGNSVRVASPDAPGLDFNDLLQMNGGAAAIRRRFQAAEVVA